MSKKNDKAKKNPTPAEQLHRGEAQVQPQNEAPLTDAPKRLKQENELLKQQVKDLETALEKKEEVKVVAKATDQKALKVALAALKISPKDVMDHREYPDKIVIVTKAGQKLTWKRK